MEICAEATADYLDLLNRAKMEPSIAVAYQEFLKLGLPVIGPHVDLDATMRAGKRVVHYKINQALLEILVAARAAKREHG